MDSPPPHSNARYVYTNVDTISEVLRNCSRRPVAEQLRHLILNGAPKLPLPGQGSTLLRWQALSTVARHSLSLVKLYEGHADALAILDELGESSRAPTETWGMWAAEAPENRVFIRTGSNNRQVTLEGTKSWCSGAAGLSHALITAWVAGQEMSQLVAVELNQPSIQIDTSTWGAVGMRDTLSADVTFSGASGTLIGLPGDYLRRPGFWHGGAGIAACWHGGTLAVADALYRAVVSMQASHPSTWYRKAALGKVDMALASLGALLHQSADWIDEHPTTDSCIVALRVRQAAEATANMVLQETGRALGATPFCRNQEFAQATADLVVFIRQSHADRDDAALADEIVAAKVYPWAL